MIYKFVIACCCLTLSAGGPALPTSQQIAEVEERVAGLRPLGDDWGTDEPYLAFRVDHAGLVKYQHAKAEDLLLFRNSDMDDIRIPKVHRGAVWKTYSFRASNNFESYHRIWFERDGELAFLLREFRDEFPKSEGYTVSLLSHYDFGQFLIIHKALITFYLVPLTPHGRELFAESDKEQRKIRAQEKDDLSWYEINFQEYEISKVADRLHGATNRMKHLYSYADSVARDESQLSN